MDQNRDYGLGRLPAPDTRDLRFPMSAAVRDVEALPRATFWRTGPVLDQGNTSQCVGYSWRQWLSSWPLPTRDGPQAAEIYAAAQQADEWPGAEPDYYGTSVRAGAKVLAELGHIVQYTWAFDMPTVRKFVLTKGPVVFGTNWYSEMFEPKNGLVRPRGANEGGHAYLCIGYTANQRMFRFINSWGAEWGQAGRFWIHEDDVARLITEGGEACAPVEQVVVAHIQEG